MTIQFLVSKPLNDFGTVLLRCKQPAEYLSNHGVNTEVLNIRNLSIGKNGIIFFHRTGYNSFTRALAKAAKYGGNILIYETDDLTLDKIGSKNFCAFCNAVSVSTEFLKQEFTSHNKNIRVLKNSLSNRFLIEASKIVPELKTESHVTLGFFSGSSTHDNDFQLIEEVLLILLHKYQNVRLLICGKINFSAQFWDFKDRFEYKSFMPYMEFVEMHRKVDILLVPMENSKFNHGKSELKFIEAGAFAIPTIASDTYTYKQVIDHEKNGIIVSSQKEWFHWVEKLICDEQLRSNIGKSARTTVMQNYIPEVRGIEYMEWLDQLNQDVKTESNTFKYYYYLYVAALLIGFKVLRAKFKLRRF